MTNKKLLVYKKNKQELKQNLHCLERRFKRLKEKVEPRGKKILLKVHRKLRQELKQNIHCLKRKLRSLEGKFEPREKKRRIQDKNSETEWQKTVNQFELRIREGYTIECESCSRLWSQSQIKKVSRQKLINSGATEIFLKYVYKNESETHLTCCTCWTKIQLLEIPQLCVSNGLEFPKISSRINCLNRVEERFVSPNHVFQSIWNVNGPRGQLKTKGGIVNVPINFDSTVSCLPRSLDDSNIIHVRLARKMEYSKDYMAGMVNIKKIFQAAKVLVKKPLFKENNINLSDDYLSLNEQLFSSETSDSHDSDTCSMYQETMLTSNTTMRCAPAEGFIPKSILTDLNSEYLAFPKLFGGYRLNPIHNNETIPYTDVAKSMLMRSDKRIAQRGDFILFMAKKLQLIRLASNVNICLRKKCLKIDSPVTTSDMLDENYVHGLLQHNDGYQIMDNVRGSPYYWQKEKTNLLAMIRQFGLPTFFITLSAADTKWPELLVQLKQNVDGKVITEDQAQKLSSDERMRLLQNDPVTSSLHFDKRFKELRKTWKSKHGPFNSLELSHFYYRIEFQQRGSPHAHMLIWLKDAPEYSADVNGTKDQDICDFIDSIVSCSSSELPPYLVCLQTHNHTRTCATKLNNKSKCRFGIPFFPMDKTRILRPLDESVTDEHRKLLLDICHHIEIVKNDEISKQLTFDDFLKKCELSLDLYIFCIRSTLSKVHLFLKREPQDMFLNPFCLKIISLMRSNMDIQFVLDPYGCACYIIDYINKPENGMSDLLAKALEEIRGGNASLRDTFRKISNTYYNNSEMSIQEACYQILQLHLSESSEQTIFIPTMLPEARVRMVKSKKQLSQQSSDSTDIFVSNILDHYANRPECLNDLTLADFAANYEFTWKQSQFTLQMRNHSGFLHKRSKPRVIRFKSYDFEVDPDNYFRNHVLLFYPWQNEDTDVIMKDNSIQFLKYGQEIIANKKKYYKIDDKVITKALNSVASDRNENEQGCEENNSEEVQRKFDFQHYQMDNEFVDVENQLNDTPATTFSEMFSTPRMVAQNEYLEMMSILNQEQRDYIMSVLKHFKTSEDPIYHFVTGGAGVGKSLLISSLYQCLIRLFISKDYDDPSQPTILLTAPTGKAAFHINGQTLHSAFKLPVNSFTLTELSADISNTMACVLRCLKLIIIDEISMVSQQVLSMIDTRLRHLFNESKCFGGISVIAVGDFFQTRPVFGRSLYNPVSSNSYREIFGHHIWHTFKVYELRTIMRQNNPEFQIALNNLARGNLTDDDIKLFRTRVFASVPPSSINATHLFARNSDVEDWNNLMLNSLPGEEITCEASDILGGSGSQSAKNQMMYSVQRAKTKECMGIPKEVKLKFGAKYMMTYNVDTSDGLCNGATGQLMSINFGTNHENKTKKPLRLWFKFDDERIGQKRRKRFQNLAKYLKYPKSWVPIDPIVTRIQTRKNSNLHVNRMMFPFTLAFALTIHKSQGLTMENVFVHTKNGLRRDLLYVACSRATSLSGLSIIGDFNPPKESGDFESLKSEINRWQIDSYTPKFKFLQEIHTEIQIMFHNIQSFQKHSCILKNDMVFLNSEIILLAETWSLSTDTCEIKDYSLQGRSDYYHERKPRGTLIHTKTKIKNFVSNNGHKLFESRRSLIEISWISLGDTVIINLYAKPKPNKLVIQMFVEFVKGIRRRRLLIMGDFNINSLAPTEMNKYVSIFECEGLILRSKEPTTKQKTSLDWILSDFELKCGSYTSCFSYHEPLWARIKF